MTLKMEIKSDKNSKLIVDKDIFEKKIIERICKGKELLNYPVSSKTKIGRRNNISSEYDESEKNAFISEYEKWKKFNLEILKRSFDLSSNEYVKEYEKAEYKVWSDFVKERKQDIQRQITVFVL